VTWLWKNRVLLPGVSVPARQVSEARTAAERRLYEAVARAAHRADPAPAPALAQLLAVPDRKRVSELERLRTPPVKSTGTAMVRAMERVEEISAFALGRVNLSWVPVNRLSTLARYGQLSKGAVRRWPVRSQRWRPWCRRTTGRPRRRCAVVRAAAGRRLGHRVQGRCLDTHVAAEGDPADDAAHMRTLPQISCSIHLHFERATNTDISPFARNKSTPGHPLLSACLCTRNIRGSTP
jgi:hypothetical protein